MIPNLKSIGILWWNTNISNHFIWLVCREIQFCVFVIRISCHVFFHNMDCLHDQNLAPNFLKLYLTFYSSIKIYIAKVYADEFTTNILNTNSLEGKFWFQLQLLLR